MQKNQFLTGFAKAKKEAIQPAQKAKKSRLKGKEKVAVRNAARNKLIKKYGLLAYKHQNELI